LNNKPCKGETIESVTMSQSLVKNLIHLVYSTKHREAWISKDVSADLSRMNCENYSNDTELNMMNDMFGSERICCCALSGLASCSSGNPGRRSLAEASSLALG